MNFSSLPQTLGDYELLELLTSDAPTKSFIALQRTVNRLVLLTLLEDNQANPEEIQSFFQSVRLKALVKESHTSAVYEALRGDDYSYYTEELPQGSSLASLLEKKEQITPFELAVLLQKIAKTQLNYKESRYRLAPWHPSSLYLSAHYKHLTFLNLILEGSPSLEQEKRDMKAVGDALLPLIAPHCPGTTRLQTLCQWMNTPSDAPQGMSWEMIQELAQTIEHQLSEGSAENTASQLPPLPFKTKPPTFFQKFGVLGILILIITLAGIISLFLLQPKKGSTSAPAHEIAASEQPKKHRSDVEITVYDSELNRAKKLSVDTHEVTIESYELFLRFIDQLLPSEKNAFLSSLKALYKNFPEEKTSFQPQDWDAMLKAAKDKGIWRDKFISLRTPVTGVDLWDAAAYAQWEKRRLPTQEEWHSLSSLDKNPPYPEKSPDVDSYKNDVVVPGIGGLAGGVAEWTSSQAIDPAFPMGGKKYVVCGGSPENKGTYSTEEFMQKASTSRFDLGFRTVKDL